MKKLLIVTLALLASSCATTKADFLRGPASEDRFDREAAGCNMEAQKAKFATPDPWMAISAYEAVFKTCMESKGYKKR